MKSQYLAGCQKDSNSLFLFVFHLCILRFFQKKEFSLKTLQRGIRSIYIYIQNTMLPTAVSIWALFCFLYRQSFIMTSTIVEERILSSLNVSLFLYTIARETVITIFQTNIILTKQYSMKIHCIIDFLNTKFQLRTLMV